MSTEITLQLTDKILLKAKEYAEKKGFDSVQNLIKELLRETLFNDDEISGLYTALASEKTLGKHWLVKEEDEAWEYLQKEK